MTFQVTCDRTDAGHGFDHGSLQAARECAAAEIAADRSESAETRREAIDFLKATGDFCDDLDCNQPANNHYEATAFTAALKFCGQHARDFCHDFHNFAERNA